MMELYELFRNGINALLFEKKILQKDFAKKMGVSVTYMNDVFRGRKALSATRMEEYAQALDTTAFEVLVRGMREQQKLPAGVVDIEHVNIIRLFSQKDLAREINQQLLELERIDPVELRLVREYLEGKLDARARAPDAAGWTSKKAKG